MPQRDKQESGTASGHGQHGASQLLSRAFAGKPAGGQLHPWAVKASAPMLVGIAVAGVRRNLIDGSVQGNGPLEKASYSLSVPVKTNGY